MKTSLPKIGRPSISGLSIKKLGSSEYHSRLWRMRHPNSHPERWTGLSPKQMGHSKYVAAWRRLKRKAEKSMNPKELEECKDAVASAIQNGAIRISVAPSRQLLDYHKKRNKLWKQGKPVHGKVRQRKHIARPELLPLKGHPAILHRAQMRIWRGKPIDDLLALVNH